MVSFSLSVKYGIIICHLTRGSDSVLFCSVSRPTDRPTHVTSGPRGTPQGLRGPPESFALFTLSSFSYILQLANWDLFFLGRLIQIDSIQDGSRWRKNITWTQSVQMLETFMGNNRKQHHWLAAKMLASSAEAALRSAIAKVVSSTSPTDALSENALFQCPCPANLAPTILITRHSKARAREVGNPNS